MQKYLALVELVSADGKQRWQPGSLIELDDTVAAIHLARGNVRPLEGTTPPAVIPEGAPPAEVVHVAPAPKSRKGKGE